MPFSFSIFSASTLLVMIALLVLAEIKKACTGK